MAGQTYLVYFAKGIALALVFLWLVLSFVPLIDVYSSTTETPWWINAGLVLTSLPVILVAYVGIRFLAVDRTKRRVDAWAKAHVPHLVVFGAAWITACTFIS